jgi:hypothetical protein
VKEPTFPKGTSAIEISFETTDARVTWDGSDPTTTVGHIWPRGQLPAFRPFGPGLRLKFASTAGTDSVLQISFFT